MERADWSGRWWGLWGAVDFLATKDRILIAAPGLANPLLDAGEIEITGHDDGRIALAGSFANHGETVVRERGADGSVIAIRLGGTTGCCRNRSWRLNCKVGTSDLTA